jgi:hypothetical protein
VCISAFQERKIKMSKKVLVISTSLRKNSNSDILADSFIKGAEDGGNSVEKVCLTDKKITFCKGCMACQNIGHCVITDDDANEITEKMLGADVIVWATPVYYYSVSGQMKTLIDRANSLFSREYKFRDVYLLSTAAEDEPYTNEGAVKAVEGWVDCFEKANLAGVVFAGGVDAPASITGHSALDEAYNMGKNVC